MIGSMAPDFGYFFSAEVSRQLTHSFSGLFIFALPAGLAVWLFYVAVLEKATITLLSDRWHTRFAHTDALTAPLIARASIAIVLGAVTHLLWDAFTHRGTFVTDAFPVLRGPTPGFSWMPIYHLLHGLSSVVGACVVGAVGARAAPPAREVAHPALQDQRAGANRRAVVSVGRVRCSSDWSTGCRMRTRHYDAQFFFAAVGTMSGFFVAWCCVAVGMWIKRASKCDGEAVAGNGARHRSYVRHRHGLTYMTSARAYVARMPKERRMPRKRPSEPIAPTTIPGEPLDPKIPEDQTPERDEERDEHEESEEEQQARESEKAFDQAITRLPPG